MTMQPGAEAWMPNGFPPPSFVVEVERVSTFTTARGRWLTAAAILGALLLLAGILLIARGGNDNTALKTGPGTTAPFDGDATFPPSTVLDPTATGVEATTGPTLPTDPNASVPAGAGGPGTTAAAPGPAGSGPPASPGILETSASRVTLPKTATESVSGTVELRNSGQSSLDYSARDNSEALTVAPDSGSIGPGGKTTVTFTLDGNKASQGDYVGSVLFSGSGGAKTVEVRATVAKLPAITPAGDEPFSFVDAISTTACKDPTWQVKARVEAFQPPSNNNSIRSVSVKVSVNNGPANSIEMTPPTDRKKGIWVLGNQAKLPTTTSKINFTFRAIDEQGSEALLEREEVQGAERSFKC